MNVVSCTESVPPTMYAAPELSSATWIAYSLPSPEMNVE
jgi:hypothetical protein